jgi:hypothetical protein
MHPQLVPRIPAPTGFARELEKPANVDLRFRPRLPGKRDDREPPHRARKVAGRCVEERLCVGIAMDRSEGGSELSEIGPQPRMLDDLAASLRDLGGHVLAQRARPQQVADEADHRSAPSR